MVTNITSLTQNGLRDWLIQRVSAIVLAMYTLFILGVLISCHPVSYESWHQLFQYQIVKLFSLIALLSLILHAWIGIWTVFTDYVKPHLLRITLQTLLFIALIVYFAWGISILWGN